MKTPRIVIVGGGIGGKPVAEVLSELFGFFVQPQRDHALVPFPATADARRIESSSVFR